MPIPEIEKLIVHKIEQEIPDELDENEETINFITIASFKNAIVENIVLLED